MKNTSSSVHMNNILHPESTAVTSLTEFEISFFFLLLIMLH